MRLVLALAAMFAASGTCLAEEPAPYRLLIEVGGGANVPLNRYIDIETEDGYMYAENSLHGQFNVSVLFGGFTFRYAANVVNIDRAEEQLPEDLHATLNEAYDLLDLPSVPRFSEGNVDQTITFHTVAVGYRFYFSDSRWQPYLPLEAGVAVVSGEALEDKALYGASLGTGFGLDVQLWDFLWAGLAVRYTFVITESYPETAILGFSSSEPSFEAAVAMEHLLGISAQLQVRY